MGVAKAALECAVRYIDAVGAKASRTCYFAWSDGDGAPTRGFEFARVLDRRSQRPARASQHRGRGVATAFLAHDAARSITAKRFKATAATSSTRRNATMTMPTQEDKNPAPPTDRVLDPRRFDKDRSPRNAAVLALKVIGPFPPPHRWDFGARY